MDDIYLPQEGEPEEPIEFEKKAIEEEVSPSVSPNASNYVKITFDRFVTLVANHSFLEVVERNKNEEVILSTNLLTDLANARRFSPRTRGPLMVIAGLAFGILLGYFLFQ